MVHVFVKAAQFLVHRRRPHRRSSDDAIGTQYDEQMPKCGAQVATRSSHRPCAVAARQVVIEKAPNRLSIDPADAEATSDRPAREVSKTAKVLANGLRGVAAFGQVMRDRINVKRKLARKQPVRWVAAKSLRRFHNGLLK